MNAIAYRPAARNRPRAWRELGLLTTLFVAYSQIRYLTRGDSAAAQLNADRVVSFERRLGFFSERGLQDLALNSEAVIAFLNRYYVGVHFPLTAVFVGWVLLRHAGWYRPIRTWFVTVSAAALAIHIAFPLVPPRMLTSEGFVDTLHQFGPSIYSTDTEHSVANQFAAMPSLHFGWALMVAVGFIAIKRTTWSLAALVHPLITLLAIVATANHYWLDAAVALALVALCAMAIVSRSARPSSVKNLNKPNYIGD
jgi:hypothetical protein